MGQTRFRDDKGALITSKHPVLECSDMLQAGILTSWKRKLGVHFDQKLDNNPMLPCGNGLQSTLCVFRSDTGFGTTSSSSASYTSQRIESGSSHSVSSPQTTSLRSG